MSDWKEVSEEGVVCYVHDELGQVTKLTEGVYVGMMPKVIKFGPFDTLEQTQQAMVTNKAVVEKMLDDFNHNLVDLAKAIKSH